MRKQLGVAAEVNGGILASPSGKLIGLVVTKKGVIYIKTKKTKKK